MNQKEKDILIAIKKYYHINKRMPTIRYLQNAFSYKSTNSIFRYMKRLEEKGYTSKGKGHGYGLTLAKSIIDNNKKLSSEKRISKNTFTQILKIKM